MNAATNFQCNSSLITILSIDGGGVRGIIPATLLDKLEIKTQLSIEKLFDFMSGVSTESILVSMLTIPNSKGLPKYTAKQVIQAYKKSAQEVFLINPLHQILSMNGLIASKYQSTGISEAGDKYFGDIPLFKLLSHVILFGYNTKSKELISFCNWQNCGSDAHYKVRDIVQGTTAMASILPPKVLKSFANKNNFEIIDASIVLNNPTAMTFIYAKRECSKSNHYLVLSLGTGRYAEITSQPKNWGFFQWLPDLSRTAIEGETTTATQIIAEFAALMNSNDDGDKLSKVLFIRINPELTDYQLDPTDPSLKHLSILENIAVDYEISFP